MSSLEIGPELKIFVAILPRVLPRETLKRKGGEEIGSGEEIRSGFNIILDIKYYPS